MSETSEPTYPARTLTIDRPSQFEGQQFSQTVGISDDSATIYVRKDQFVVAMDRDAKVYGILRLGTGQFIPRRIENGAEVTIFEFSESAPAELDPRYLVLSG